MVRSISWVINANGEGEIMGAVQDNLAPIMPTSVLADLISEPILGSTSSPRAHRSPPRHSRKPIQEEILIASIDRITNGLAECLFLAESVLDQSATGDKFPPLHQR
jgi:hypothetical protein